MANLSTIDDEGDFAFCLLMNDRKEKAVNTSATAIEVFSIFFRHWLF